jgi:hypothetical protein
MSEALLQLFTHGRVVANEIARLDEQIKEIEVAATRLELLVCGERGLKRLLQKGSKVGVTFTQKDIKVGFHRVSACEHLIARQTSKGGPFSSFPGPAPITGHIAQGSLETIIVSTADCLEALILETMV